MASAVALNDCILVSDPVGPGLHLVAERLGRLLVHLLDAIHSLIQLCPHQSDFCFPLFAQTAGMGCSNGIATGSGALGMKSRNRVMCGTRCESVSSGRRSIQQCALCRPSLFLGQSECCVSGHPVHGLDIGRAQGRGKCRLNPGIGILARFKQPRKKIIHDQRVAAKERAD